MPRELDRSKPFGYVYGDDPGVEHRYYQFGMKFDAEGNLVGPEVPVQAGPETEQQMRTRVEKEVREQVAKEMRERHAESAKIGGTDDVLDELSGKKTVVGKR